MLKGIISYWILPVIAAVVWCGMLLGMLLHWIIDTDRKHYDSMAPELHTAYISNIGAAELKPLFIAGCCVTTVFFDLGFAADRWLRHRGRLVPNQTFGEKFLMLLTIIFAIAGTAGLILLSIFDTVHHRRLHDGFLLLFMGGYVISAIFVCWEYQRLGIKNRQHRVLAISFWVKLTFIIVEVLLAIVFASTTFTKKKNVAAIFEWIIAFVFTFYILSFVIDLYPAIHTRAPDARFKKPSLREMEKGNSSDNQHYPRNYQMDNVPNDF